MHNYYVKAELHKDEGVYYVTGHTTDKAEATHFVPVKTGDTKGRMSIYNPGTRLGLIRTLVDMRTYLDKDEQELKDLTDSAIAKLNLLTDAEFSALDLIPDFDEEE